MEVIKVNGNLPVSFENMESYEVFGEYLKTEPSVNEISALNIGGNRFAKYIPIGTIEKKLDQFFGCMGWQIKNFSYSVVANEIIGQLELWVRDPISREWIVRTGVGAVMIQTKSQSNPMDINNKIRNTLVKDAPHLKTECLKNAAKSLGNYFGRSLNREDDVEYGSFKETIVETEAFKDEVGQLIKDCKSLDDLRNLMTKHKDWKNNLHILQLFNTRKKEIEGGKI